MKKKGKKQVKNDAMNRCMLGYAAGALDIASGRLRVIAEAVEKNGCSVCPDSAVQICNTVFDGVAVISRETDGLVKEILTSNLKYSGGAGCAAVMNQAGFTEGDSSAAPACGWNVLQQGAPCPGFISSLGLDSPPAVSPDISRDESGEDGDDPGGTASLDEPVDACSGSGTGDAGSADAGPMSQMEEDGPAEAGSEPAVPDTEVSSPGELEPDGEETGENPGDAGVPETDDADIQEEDEARVVPEEVSWNEAVQVQETEAEDSGGTDAPADSSRDELLVEDEPPKESGEELTNEADQFQGAAEEEIGVTPGETDAAVTGEDEHRSEGEPLEEPGKELPDEDDMDREPAAEEAAVYSREDDTIAVTGDGPGEVNGSPEDHEKDLRDADAESQETGAAGAAGNASETGTGGVDASISSGSASSGAAESLSQADRQEDSGSGAPAKIPGAEADDIGEDLPDGFRQMLDRAAGEGERNDIRRAAEAARKNPVAGQLFIQHFGHTQTNYRRSHYAVHVNWLKKYRDETGSGETAAEVAEMVRIVFGGRRSLMDMMVSAGFFQS